MFFEAVFFLRNSGNEDYRWKLQLIKFVAQGLIIQQTGYNCNLMKNDVKYR